MLLHLSFLPIAVASICSIVAAVFLLRARRHYIKPRGLSLLGRGSARCSTANYTAEGVVLVRQARLSALLLAYALFGCLLIYWVYSNTRH
jgi:hypothetical protein